MKIFYKKEEGFAQTPTLNRTKLVCGFTLVELMVAIAIFSVVMVTATSALLNVIDANNKARAIKTAINNISFALEGISKDMRVGTNYLCADDPGVLSNRDEVGQSCPNGGSYIGYRSTRADKIDNKYQYAFYRYNDTEKSIEECLEQDSKTCYGASDFSRITSEEVQITNANFYVLNTGDLTVQPKMIMTISGEAGSKEKIKTTFDLQTSISQRTRVKTL